MVDFVPLGTLSGPGAPDPDLAPFHIRAKHGILNISLYYKTKLKLDKEVGGGVLL